MNEVSIVLCGEAGSGIQTVEKVTSRILKLSGYNVFATKEYMSRVRGGMNSTEIRVADERAQSFVEKIDILVALDKGAIEHLKGRIAKDTLILGEEDGLERPGESSGNFVGIPWNEIAEEIGGEIYANMVGAGIITGLFEVENEVIEEYLASYFSEKGSEVIEDNIRAVKRGNEIAGRMEEDIEIDVNFKPTEAVDREILVNGTEAVAMGALAGGCNFLSFYPMSPSTGVGVFLAQHAEEFDVIVEQAEDEISAINMVLGAWYSGGRGLVTTSGGGFALMTESLSLSAMIESPIVIHLAQRPGPATGLPTRTEQGDLLFSLFGGHGEFPRVIYSPGNLKEAFYLSHKAFNVADKFQVPVIILTDQYLLNSYYNIPSFEISALKNEFCINKTSEGYKRFELTEDGISPRGIPGYGEGLVAADSDEHDESGHITEDHSVRVDMVQKRLQKKEQLREQIVPPELIGSQDYEILVLGWGSTRNAIREALEKSDRDDISLLHFKQVYPLYDAGEYLSQAEKIAVIENNATSQFGKLIKMETDFEVDEELLKYDGITFSKEEVTNFINKL